MDTFELLPSLAQGDLSQTSAPELVAAVFRTRASGTLYFESAGVEARVFFRTGEMAGTGVFSGFQTLAQVLLANDWVDALTIDSTRSEAEQLRKRHGEILVARGVFTAERLREGLALQHRSNLGRVLAFREGRYEWRGSEPPPGWAREVPVDPVVPLLEALALPVHAACRARILSWLGNAAARLGPDWPELAPRFAAFEHRSAVALFSEAKTAQEFFRLARLDAGRSEGLLAGLLLAGAVEPVALQAEVPAAAPVQPLLEPLNAPGAPVDEHEVPLIPVEEDEAPSAPRELELQPEDEAPLELMTGPRVPGEPIHAPPLSEEDAFSRIDQLELDEAPADSPGSDRGEAARELRRRMQLRGMRNLGVLPGDSPGDGSAAEEAPLAPLDLAKLSPADRAFVDEVRARLRTLDSEDVYVRLGVSRDLAQDGLKAAYLAAVKRFHPDRASGPLEGLQPELSLLFSGLREAWDLVSTPELRARYDVAGRAGASPPSSKREEGALALQMGEVLLKRRDFDAALAKLRRATELDPSGDTFAALAWGLLSHPRTPQKDEALSIVERALRLPGVTARTHYVLGVLLRTKDPARAMASFRAALELEPGHSDAALELRLLEQRRAPKAAPDKPGVLSGLFKRKP